MAKKDRSNKFPLQPSSGPRRLIKDELITQLLSHVAYRPDHVAIITTHTTWTYQQLYEEVLTFCEALSPYCQDRVVVCIERSPDLLAVLLALQWLEMTYIPVDPAIPVEWLQDIIIDSQAQLILYDAAPKATFSTLPCLPLSLSELKERKERRPYPVPQIPKQSAMAYIIYTSGSTGKPKGVAISRKALNNFLTAMSRNFLNREKELVLAITTISFDIAALELYLPIWQGQSVFIADKHQHKDPAALTHILSDYPITLLQATPGMWSLLNSVDWEGQPDLVALCGGEPLNEALAQHLLSKVGELWNMYGPTEATIWCSIKKIQPGEPITVGAPIDNMDMCVLDDAGNLLPPYVKGELYIGGLGLAEGYVNNKTLNESRFIKNPHILGGRLYRVGDLACRTPQGEFIIFGRTDNQVKLHGYRIELECIEAQIKKLASIRDCAVVVFQEQLVAYLCLTQANTFSEEMLMGHLANKLPDYMLPKRIVIIDNLPLTTSGKVDRKSLQLPPSTIISSEPVHSEATPLELLLMRIWSEELKTPHVGIHDIFFQLGGHSLIAARIVIRIHEQVGKKITVQSLYKNPTIAKLAEIIAQTNTEAFVDDLPTKKPIRQAKSALPLNDFQLILWLTTVFLPHTQQLNVVARRRVQGPLNQKALDLALQLVFQKHEVFRYSINSFLPMHKVTKKQSPQWIETSLLEFDESEYNDYLHASLEEINEYHRWGMQEPWIIAKLFYLKDNQIEFQVSLPHLIADENSVDIFFDELSDAYLFYVQHAKCNAKDAMLPYSSYVLNQQVELKKYAKTDALFWKTYLKDAGLFCFPKHEVVNALADKNISFSTYIELSEALLSSLRRYAIDIEVSISAVISAAISLALCESSDDAINTHALFLNLVKSTRRHVQYDQEIGCFLQVEPVKVILKAHRSLLDVSKQIHQSVIETAEHQRASSFVKLASIGHFPRKRSWKSYWIRLMMPLIISLFRLFHLDKSLAEACAVLADFKRQNHFLIDINILSNFLIDPSKSRRHLFDASEIEYPLYPIERTRIDSVFEACFLRDDGENKPYLVISSNLQPAFRQRIGQLFIEILQRELN